MAKQLGNHMANAKNTKFKLVTIISEPVLANSLIATIRNLGAKGFTTSDIQVIRDDKF